jgi:DNA-binding MarR family transcriptional regulator
MPPVPDATTRPVTQPDQAIVSPVEPLDPHELPSGLRTAIARLSRRLRQTRAGADLSPTQYQVLATLVRVGPVRLSDLATTEGLNPTMLSRIAAKLEAASLVARTPDRSDGRVVHLAAAPAGRDLVGQVRRERTDALSRALDGLSEADRQALLVALPVLEVLAEALKSREP